MPSNEHIDNLKKLRFDAAGNFYFLTGNDELVIRTKTHIKIRTDIKDFGVSSSGRLHLLDMKSTINGILMILELTSATNG